MSFVKKSFNKVGSILSGGGDVAARDAARIQSASGDKAIALQRETRDLVRKDLQPFREAGEAQLDPLTNLITNPQAQLDFIQQNPFFTALADDAQSRLFSNQAARGKVGSGGTAEALQNSLLLLGQDLLNQNIGQRSNLATMGQNAATGQATATQNAGNTITDLITQQGNVLAAGEVGAANAIAGGIQSGIQGGSALATLALSDKRAKEDIKQIGEIDNIPVYTFRYKGSVEPRIGVMAQDIEKTHPHAVHEINGLKHVDYGELWH